MLKHYKTIFTIVGITLGILLVSIFSFGAIEPQTVSAITASSSVVITLTVNQEISITSPPNSSMSTALGVSQNTAVGTTTWNVKTNDGAGYTMAVKATSTPAMQSSSFSILDYQTGTPNLWVATSGSAYFGHSAFGSDTATSTWGTGAVCSGGSAHAISTTLKYQGFQTSNGTNIASRTSTTTPSGVDTTVCYAVEQNNYFIAADTYKATIVATATGL